MILGWLEMAHGRTHVGAVTVGRSQVIQLGTEDKQAMK